MSADDLSHAIRDVIRDRTALLRMQGKARALGVAADVNDVVWAMREVIQVA